MPDTTGKNEKKSNGILVKRDVMIDP